MMPSSSAKGVPFIQSWLPKIEPRTRILDVGCGKGNLPKRYREPGQHWTGVEIFKRYIVEDIARYRDAATPALMKEIAQ